MRVEVSKQWMQPRVRPPLEHPGSEIVKDQTLRHSAQARQNLNQVGEDRRQSLQTHDPRDPET